MKNDRGVKKWFGMGAAAAAVILLAAIAVHRLACNKAPPVERSPGSPPVTPSAPATTQVAGGAAGASTALAYK